MKYSVETLSKRELMAKSPRSDFESALAEYLNSRAEALKGVLFDAGNVTFVFEQLDTKAKK